MGKKGWATQMRCQQEGAWKAFRRTSMARRYGGVLSLALAGMAALSVSVRADLILPGQDGGAGGVHVAASGFSRDISGQRMIDSVNLVTSHEWQASGVADAGILPSPNPHPADSPGGRDKDRFASNEGPSGGTHVRRGLHSASAARVVPEPATMVLAGAGMVLLGVLWTRTRRTKKVEGKCPGLGLEQGRSASIPPD